MMKAIGECARNPTPNYNSVGDPTGRIRIRFENLTDDQITELLTKYQLSDFKIYDYSNIREVYVDAIPNFPLDKLCLFLNEPMIVFSDPDGKAFAG